MPVSSFEQNLLAVISDLQSVETTYYEELLHEHDHEYSNTVNMFDHFISVDTKHSAFDDDLRTFSYLENLIAAVSNEIDYKLHNILI